MDLLDPLLHLGVSGINSVLRQTLMRGRFDGDVINLVIRALLIGLFITACRKIWTNLYNQAELVLFPSAYILKGDPAFAWIMAWIAQDPGVQRQLHQYALTTESHARKGDLNVLNSATAKSATWISNDVVAQILPAYNQTILIRHQRSRLWVRRKVGWYARSALRQEEHFVITTWAFNSNALKDFIIDAHQAYFAKDKREILIFHPKRLNPNWHLPFARPSRPWSSVILPGDIKERLLTDMTNFLSDKEISWYGARGIPHRRGYLFHGTAGSGKTTLATALATALKLDIFTINPGQRGMDDSKLRRLLGIPRRAIILIEDIDCIFPSRESLPLLEDDSGSFEGPISNTNGLPTGQLLESVGKHDLAPSTVTMSGLLNAIDGVSSQEGCLLIASTNYPERLDPALSRPGRFDVRIAFHNATLAQAKALFLNFYPLMHVLALQDNAKISIQSDPLGAEKSEPVKLVTSDADLEALADEFASNIFPTGEMNRVGGQQEVEVSMAALQGYLLRYKEDPQGAVKDSEEWAESAEVRDWVKAASFMGSNRAPLGLSALLNEVGDEPETTGAGQGNGVQQGKPKKKAGTGVRSQVPPMKEKDVNAD